VQQQYEPAPQILIEVTAPAAPVQEPIVILESSPSVVIIPEPVDAVEPQAPIVVALANEPVEQHQEKIEIAAPKVPSGLYETPALTVSASASSTSGVKKQY